MTTYRLMDGVSGRPGVSSSGTQPPSAGLSYSGNYVAGLVFQVTVSGTWFQGYWWWVPATTSQTTAQKFALWQIDGSETGTLVSGSVVTSGTLTAAAWNYVALSAPLLLPPGIVYTAATGYVSTTGFPDTQNQFGASEQYHAGITNGPLSAYSSTGGTAAVPSGWMPQQPFATSGSDPSTTLPNGNDADDLLWLDVQVSDTAPAGSTYRTWPNMPSPIGISVPNTSNDYTLGMEFSLSQACTLNKIWHYSPSGSVVLPSRCGIWNVSTTSEVSGTDNSSPAWLDPSGSTASAGDGWVYCDYSSSGVILSSGVNYKVATFYGASTTNKWLAVTTGYWTSGGPGASGFTMGPLVVPNNGSASPGQSSWNSGTTWTYPATSNSPENDWIDVEVAIAPYGSVTTASWALSGSGSAGSSSTTSSGSVASAAWALAGAGKGGFISTGSTATTAWALSGSAAETFTCSGSAGAAAWVASGSGGGGNIASSGTVAGAAWAVSASGGQGTFFTGSGSVAAAANTPSSTGVLTFTGTGTLAAHFLTISGAGVITFSGTGSAGIATSTINANGSQGQPVTSSGTLAMAARATSANGEQGTQISNLIMLGFI